MSARRVLRGGLPRLFDDHRSVLGRLYRAEYERLVREAGPAISEEVRQLAADVAELRVRKAFASRAWASLAERRLRGKGRKPTEARVRGGAKRAALDGKSYRLAVAEFRALVAGGNGQAGPPSIAELVAASKRGAE
jgi:hypothetical protein